MRISKDERKLSLYFPFQTLREINRVASQLDRPKSWVIQKAWDVAKKTMLHIKPKYKEKWKNDFLEALSEVHQRNEALSAKESEELAINLVKSNKSF